MRVPNLRIIIGILAATAVCACQTVSVGELAMLAPDYKDVPIDILAKDVEGEECVSQWTNRGVHPSYGKAIANALRKVPEANVMQDVSFELRHKFFNGDCAWVKGNAGKFR